ncbi:hypothetical protein [Phaeacidiphilus oryzae]|uniref:hypothetical protein n=1 Tax=Phaeacidiphilus oryzae TaxID=348818 RepID=UPI000569E2E5|nr:hypothetical protein [Phaeacidiphilus oryzae]
MDAGIAALAGAGIGTAGTLAAAYLTRQGQSRGQRQQFRREAYRGFGGSLVQLVTRLTTFVGAAPTLPEGERASRLGEIDELWRATVEQWGPLGVEGPARVHYLSLRVMSRLEKVNRETALWAASGLDEERGRRLAEDLRQTLPEVNRFLRRASRVLYGSGELPLLHRHRGRDLIRGGWTWGAVNVSDDGPD